MQIKFRVAYEELGNRCYPPEKIEGLHTEALVRPVENDFFSSDCQVVLVIGENKPVVIALADLESVVAAFKAQFG